MRRYAHLSALIAAALFMPAAASAAEPGAPEATPVAAPAPDLTAAYFGDLEVALTSTAPAATAAAAAATATRIPAADLTAQLDVQNPMAGPEQSLSDEELGGQRGGFMTPMGLEIGFGAIVRTTIDGALALEQTMTVTDQGIMREVTAGALTPDVVGAAAAGGINLDPNGGLQGVVQQGDGGATAVLTGVGNSFFSSLVVNTASNRQISQDTQITLNIPNFAAAQQQMIGQQVQMRLDQEIGSILAASLPH